MDSQTKNEVASILEGMHFEVVADLGCGYGNYADLLKKHCKYLIGVDKDINQVITSGYSHFYDKLIERNIAEGIPDASAYFMFDVIEHLNRKTDFYRILDWIGSRYCLITTPSKYSSLSRKNHKLIWTPMEIRLQGFGYKIFSRGELLDSIYGKVIIAWRGY